MKIKLDFVSNSSSTSFVYISEVELTEDAFLEAAGVERDGPVGDLFVQMHGEIEYALQRGATVTSKEAVDQLAGTHGFTPDVIQRMKDAIVQGKKVSTGSLSSDGALAESLLCMAMFEVESDAFYINAYDNYW
ncbi:hypothetical protein [Paracoccus laeviglucosivorans]|uniref:Uncharacterized protein n=1 Tax=Paracoccus laeviglucosivorans TaxID=1197861 RepID=A0A521FS53_9RHOB|nr:hypothetical protein [Paracoccus laeviglucosivorans]SMO98946.1 hypothetical protein SAMN06265221_1392 [Paracoccus laeviglucosivorans]